MSALNLAPMSAETQGRLSVREDNLRASYADGALFSQDFRDFQTEANEEQTRLLGIMHDCTYSG